MRYPREGLRIRTEVGVHAEVKRACLEFAEWLRTKYNFPIRVVVYLKKDYQIKNRHTKNSYLQHSSHHPTRELSRISGLQQAIIWKCLKNADKIML